MAASVMPELAGRTDFRICDLGPLRLVVDGTEVAVRGAILARLLSRLVISANRRVSVDELIVAVWGEPGHDRHGAALESHIWRLRRMLEPHREVGASSLYVSSVNGGYRLNVSPDSVDSLRFVQLADRGDELLLSGETQRARQRFELALELWRGHPFDALGEQDCATAAISRLDDVHLNLTQQHIESLLRLGETSTALALLHRLTEDFPFREGLWRQQMIALYREGRTADALDTFQRARQQLVNELGVEPGPELRQLQTKILQQDPELAPTPPRSDPVSTPNAQPGVVQLPARLSQLIGRDQDLAAMVELVRQHRLVTIVGAAGCGKTRLAIEVARSSTDLAPDGIWFVDLTAVDDATQVIDCLVSALGVPASTVGLAVDDLRAHIRDRQGLLVIDNCEHVIDAVADLIDEMLDQDVECRVLATSREPLALDGEVVWTVEPLRIRDDRDRSHRALSPAAQLFWTRLESADPDLQATEQLTADAEAICAAVDGVPLAIELAAARARSFTLSEIRTQIASDVATLARIGSRGTPHHQSVDLSIDWSVRLIDERDQLLHARLSVLPGIFGLDVAVAVAGSAPLSPADVPDGLARLVHRSLVAVVPPTKSGQHMRYRQLVTVRAHAGLALRRRGELDQTLARRTAWLVAFVAGRPAPSSPDTTGWHLTLEDNHDTLTAVLQHTLVDQPDPQGVHLAAQVSYYWYNRRRTIEGSRWMEAAQHVEAEPADRAMIHLGAACLHALRDRADLAAVQLRAALALDAAIDPARLAEGLAACSHLAWLRNDHSLALVVPALRRIGAHDPAIMVYADLADAQLTSGSVDPEETLARADELVAVALHHDNLSAAWVASWLGMVAALLAEDPVAGNRHLTRTTTYLEQIGGTADADALEFAGNFAVLTGEDERGVRLLSQSRASAFLAGSPWPISPYTQVIQDRARDRLSAAEYELAWRLDDRRSSA